MNNSNCQSDHEGRASKEGSIWVCCSKNREHQNECKHKLTRKCLPASKVLVHGGQTQILVEALWGNTERMLLHKKVS